VALSTLQPTQKEKIRAIHGKAKLPTITERGRLAEIRTCVQLCLDAIGDESGAEIARRTGLSVTTIYRLTAGDVSLAMHVNTLQCLGYAAGLRIEMTETKIMLSLGHGGGARSSAAK
jgi:hypothetical protein